VQDRPTKRDYATDGEIAKKERKEAPAKEGNEETPRVGGEEDQQSGEESIEIKKEEEEGPPTAGFTFASHLHRHYAFRSHVR